MEAAHHRTVVAVDLDQTLAKLLESALKWHNAERDTEVRFETACASSLHANLRGCPLADSWCMCV